MAAVAARIAAAGVEAVAVCFLHSLRQQPEHEQRCAGILRERLPDVPGDGLVGDHEGVARVRADAAPPSSTPTCSRRRVRYLRALDGELTRVRRDGRNST